MSVFVGSGVALVTPFNESGVDFEAFEKTINFVIEEGSDAVIVAGTTGEASTMSDKEQLDAIEFVVKTAAGRVPVVAGTGSNDTAHCMELSQEAEKRGADALLVVTPYYNKTSPRGLVKHYTMVADSVGIPIIMYNVPGRTGMSMSASVAAELSKHKNIVGIKEASGNISLVAQIAAACGEDFDIYSGNDDMITPLLSLGGKGVITTVGNIIPRDVHDVVAKFMAGDVKGSCQLQLKMLELIDAVFVEVNPIPIKMAMNLMGYNVGKLRAPLCEMVGGNLEVLKKAMKNYGLLR